MEQKTLVSRREIVFTWPPMNTKRPCTVCLFKSQIMTKWTEWVVFLAIRLPHTGRNGRLMGLPLEKKMPFWWQGNTRTRVALRMVSRIFSHYVSRNSHLQLRKKLNVATPSFLCHRAACTSLSTIGTKKWCSPPFRKDVKWRSICRHWRQSGFLNCDCCFNRCIPSCCACRPQARAA